MKKEVLGIKIDDITMDQAMGIVVGWLKKGKGKHYIVTPNPEIVIMAKEDEELKKILNQADLAIPDGVGLRLGTDIVCHTPGIDLMEVLIKLSEDYGFTVGLLGGRDGVAKKAGECLRKKYPKLKVTFASSGGEINKDGNVILNEVKDLSLASLSRSGRMRVPNKSGDSSPDFHRGQNDIPQTDILFVAFGPPKQEKWIARNINKIPVKVAMGVGGAFDYISGEIPRAPKIIRDLGFEWLFRLVVQPWRIKRQLALLKYLILLVSSRTPYRVRGRL